MMNRIVFIGSPEFSVPILETLYQNFIIAGVVTQPDRPSGRGRELKPTPVKQVALKFSIPFIQPNKIKEPGVLQQITQWSPDLIIVAAYGQIIRENILNLPEYGCINVHASLLPRWRGAAPIQAAILSGDPFTGITIMKMDPGLDTGPILTQERIPIQADDTAGTLGKKLSILGATLLLRTIPGYLQARIKPRLQDETQVTYAPILKKENGELDFLKPAEQLVNQVRAFNPWPGAFIFWKGSMIKIHRAHIESPVMINGKIESGKKIIWQNFPAIQTATDLFVIDEIQPSGKKSMSGNTFLHGVRDWN
jgi:methionyl-tRNA formyltransferase